MNNDANGRINMRFTLPSEGISLRLAVLGKGIETGNLPQYRYEQMVQEPPDAHNGHLARWSSRR